MQLCIDIGNSRIKAAVFKGDQLAERHAWKSGTEPLKQLLADYSFEGAILSATKDYNPEIDELLQPLPLYLKLNGDTPLPFVNDYATPQTLGRDRIANAAGAQLLHPHSNCLAIDAGTSLTYDLIDVQGHYQGGAISPGISMRFKALHTFTGKLPLIQRPPQGDDIPLIGKTTEQAIQSGVLNTILAEVEGTISRYQQLYPQLNVLITGGDATFFENKLEKQIFAVPNLTLYGLHAIISHQQKQAI